MFTITVSFKTATSIDDSFRFDVRSRTLEEKRTYLPTNTFQMVEEIFGRIALEKKGMVTSLKECKFQTTHDRSFVLYQD